MRNGPCVTLAIGAALACLGKGSEAPSGKTTGDAQAKVASDLGMAAGTTTGKVTRGILGTSTQVASGKAIVTRVVGTLRVIKALVLSANFSMTIARPIIGALVSMGADSSCKFATRHFSAALGAATFGRSSPDVISWGLSSAFTSAAGPVGLVSVAVSGSMGKAVARLPKD